jgi:hypothetical protein
MASRAPHPLLRPAAVRLYVAAALFITWIVLVCAHVQGAEELIQFCRFSIAALGVHHVSTSKQS